ncbi:MAG: heavy metal-binding domain-containing protein [Nostoc sp.]|uniref:heavy metal-binding domain-containing protein n=1 Tax=Nostoc sp. TaxID=1180 RepID=UPI002FF7249E
MSSTTGYVSGRFSHWKQCLFTGTNGFVGGITSAFKSFVRGEINELTTLIYEAREQAIANIATDARNSGADLVVGIKTYVYQLGSGIIEFMAIGTAVKKLPGITTHSTTLIPQAIISDRDTFVNTALPDNLKILSIS